MVLNYKVYLKDGIFKYSCLSHDSYMEIKDKNIKKIYDILKQLDAFQKQAARYRMSNCICNDFVIIFDFRGYIKIENASNWLNIKEEVPIIKKELSKYVKEYDTENIKDIIIKIKSLKRGRSNIIKEELK